jgi:Pvc16 N-terminal domain
MNISESGRAIASVTELIKNHILNEWQIPPKPDVTIGRPETTGTTPSPDGRLNLFLYELRIDPFLRNRSLGPARLPPVWLIAKYILTAFDEKGESDTSNALKYLGEGIRLLDLLKMIPTPPLPELDQNPETLKLTIEDVGVEVLSRLMQGPDQRYRSSVGFEVKPLMVASAEVPSYSLLVGIDYTKTPVIEIREEGIRIDIDSLSTRPSISKIVPQKFEIEDTFILNGKNLDASDLFAYLDSFKLRIDIQKRDSLKCVVSLSDIEEKSIMAGNHAIYLVQNLTSVRRRTSNTVIGSLIPKVDSATTNALVKVHDPDAATGKELITGNIDVVGNLLGRKNADVVVDDVVVGLYKNGETTNVLTKFEIPPVPLPGPPQHSVRLPIDIKDDVVAGTYRIIYTVNGQQAKNSPEVILDTP